MKCEHGNLIRVEIKQVSPPYDDDGHKYLFVGCDQCNGIELVDRLPSGGFVECRWIPNDGDYHEGLEE